ncbi:MAG: DMT family transporter [Rhodobacter sp.]|nr:DMT family transporter [Paracoccaceae bacterium]MCC0079788.1 DMT family transporter [Rhodobacter sp.]
MVLAMACFAVEDACVKSAAAIVPPSTVMIGFGLTAMAVFAALALIRGERVLPPLSRGLAVRAGFELAGRLFYSLALAFSGLGVTSAILQATPLVVVSGAVWVFGERVGWRRWTAIGLGLIGVLMVLRPSASGVTLSALFALLGMIGFAGRDLATRAAPPTVTNAQLGVLGMGVLFLAGVVVAAVSGQMPVVPPVAAVGRILGAALFGVSAYAALTAAMRMGEVSVVTPFRYTRLVFALGLAWMLFGEVPDAMMLAGSVLIVGSGLFTLARGRRMV